MSPASDNTATLPSRRADTAGAPWYSDGARWRLIALEILVTAVLLAGYFLVRGMRPDDVEASVDRSLAVVHFEQQIGLFQEVRWQEAVLPHKFAMDAANLIYAWGHYPVLFAIGLWLVIKDPARFRFVRNVMVVSAVVGIATYWLLPTAPPRLMGLHGYDFGFVDTVHGAASNTAYFQPGPFVNDYAALPSFHFGWIMLASAALWANTRMPFVRAAAVLMSVVMWWAVTVTGNHYFFDMIMGGLVVAGSWMFVGALSSPVAKRWLRQRLPGARRLNVPARTSISRAP